MGADQTDRSQTEHRDRQRVTVAEAAEIFGITAEAVRTRIKRGKLESVKEPPTAGGTVYVLLEADQARPNADPTSQGYDQTADQTGAALLEAKDDLIATLREQLQAERQAHAEARRLLLRALERIPPQLEPPAAPEPREEPDASPVRPEKAEPAVPVDPQREEPEKVGPERVEPERTEPERTTLRPSREGAQESRESPLRPGPSDTSTETTDASGSPQRATERRWWEFWR